MTRKILKTAVALLITLSPGNTGCATTAGTTRSASAPTTSVRVDERVEISNEGSTAPIERLTPFPVPEANLQLASTTRRSTNDVAQLTSVNATDDGLHIPTLAELELFELINKYRAGHKQSPIPWSRSLSHIAWLHARDLSTHRPPAGCMIHSWSQNSEWTPCCYTPDHAAAKCMWNKPLELTQYHGIGFEIAYLYTAGVRPVRAVEAWSQSPRHREVLLNLAVWGAKTWRAIGVGIDGDYATVWVGEDIDPAGYWSNADDNRM